MFCIKVLCLGQTPQRARGAVGSHYKIQDIVLRLLRDIRQKKQNSHQMNKDLPDERPESIPRRVIACACVSVCRKCVLMS